jgi:hypothetical protein
MLYMEIITVCTEINTKHRSVLCGQKLEQKTVSKLVNGICVPKIVVIIRQWYYFGTVCFAR